ncbi:cyclic GMP-AMP synthase-like receptor [Phlebotomus argentipes]|uniref:cyclic GMP-AMP synthase-like receptor n=1 Tax=Phlebotomus argentipes TaxID=94469 RepID=UPI00289305BC|nr:cyclic GMP-AMP synthase-like receptor [Phlebotomus argentipes]
MNVQELTIFTGITHAINQFITLDSKDREEYMKHCNVVRQSIDTELKNNSDLYKKISNGFEYAGSYRDNLKVSKPNEYDLIMKMKLPLSPDKVIVKPDKAGYLTINVKNLLEEMAKIPTMTEAHKELAKMTDKFGYLLQNKWLAWLESKIHNSVTSVKQLLASEYTLKHEKHGPAQTLNVTSKRDSHISFSIDFVFGITFDLSKWIATRKPPKLAKEEDKFYMAIPKPNKLNPGEENRLWIASYPAQDNVIIHNKNRLKDAIRFIKKIRDTQVLPNLKSYYIKTVVMLETDKRPDSYWNSSFDIVLKDMLNATIQRFEEKKIPSYWNKNFNIIEGLNDGQRQAIISKLKKVKRTWDTVVVKEKIMETILSPHEVEILSTTINVCGKI